MDQCKPRGTDANPGQALKSLLVGDISVVEINRGIILTCHCLWGVVPASFFFIPSPFQAAAFLQGQQAPQQ